MAGRVGATVSAVGTLTPNEKTAFFRIMYGQFMVWQRANMPNGVDLREIEEVRFSNGIDCPHCRATNVVRWGRTCEGKQRYRCKACRKTFNPFTKTPYANLKHLNRIGDIFDCMAQGLSVRDVAARTGIHYVTAFRWRHRFLEALRHQPEATLTGVVEADETSLRESFKGQRVVGRAPRRHGPRPGEVLRGLSRHQVCVLTAQSRDKVTLAKPIGRGAPNYGAVRQGFDGHIQEGSILCTDGAHHYERLSRELRLRHVKTSDRVDPKMYGVHHINAYHNNLKTWMKRFRGVATSYLSNYLAWHIFVSQAKGLRTNEVCMKFGRKTCAAA